MATSYHMEALRKQRVIERAVAARLRMELAARRAIESIEPPSIDPAQESNKQYQQSNRTASAKSRDTNRTLSRHSSHHSRASTAATLTQESQLLSPIPPSPRGSADPLGSQQLERPTSKRESGADNKREQREGSIHGNGSEKREGESVGAKSRDGSKLIKRDTGTADKTGEIPKSVTSSKRNSRIPEETAVTKEVPAENVKQTDPPVGSPHSSRKSNRPESHNKATNT